MNRMRGTGYGAVVGAWFMVCGSGATERGLEQASAGEIQQSVNELPALARQAKDQFVPVTEERVHKAKSRLASAARRLSAYLDAGGKNGAAWKRYLKWDALQNQLQPAAELDLNSLVDVYRRLTDDYAGLELSVFSQLADPLEQYIDLAAMTALPEPADQYRRTLDEIAGSLERYAEKPLADDHASIGERLGWFEGSGQAPRLVLAVRKLHSRPNLYLQASSRLLSAGMSRPVDRVDPFRDVILGTRTTGSTHTRAHVDVRLIPSSNRAVLETVLTGHSTSDTVGRNGPVRIYSNGWTQISANKRLLVDEHGIEAMPASSRATTSTHVRDIATQKRCLSGLVRRVAWKRVRQQKAQAESIAARRAEKRINRRVDSEAHGPIAKAQDGFLNQFRRPLLRRHEFPQLLHFSSCDRNMYIKALQANRFQLGAPTNPPEIEGDFDIQARIHESLINNLAAGLIAGRTYTRDDVEREAQEWFGKLPESLKRDDDEEPWSITFARRQPVSVEFADRGVKITVRGSRYTAGENSYQSMNVTALYSLERTPQGSRLVRQGDLEILPPRFVPGTSRLSAQEVALRTLLTKRFGKLFEPQIERHGLELPGNWRRAGKLRLQHLDSQSGWLTAAWSLPSRLELIARRGVDTP
jgi:hypothetical protein